jgi:hypothetical protein
VSGDVGVREAYRSLSVGDFDNDGDQDMYVDHNTAGMQTIFLLNEEASDGSRVFGDVAQAVNVTEMTESYSSATTDYNADGWIDILVVGDNDRLVFYKNVSTLQNNWVGFKLKGTRSNRDAIGAWVRIVAGGKSQIRTMFAGDGRFVQQLPWMHFGIGTATKVDSLIVDWPLGGRDIWLNFDIKKYHTLVEGAGTVGIHDENMLPTEFRLEQNYPNPFNPRTNVKFVVPTSVGTGTTKVVTTIKVFDVLGREVATLVQGFRDPGVYEVEFDGSNLSSGMYFYRLSVFNQTATGTNPLPYYTETKKMILQK